MAQLVDVTLQRVDPKVAPLMTQVPTQGVVTKKQIGVTFVASDGS